MGIRASRGHERRGSWVVGNLSIMGRGMRGGGGHGVVGHRGLCVVGVMQSWAVGCLGDGHQAIAGHCKDCEVGFREHLHYRGWATRGQVFRREGLRVGPWLGAHYSEKLTKQFI
jgi:hypothetical protein